MFVFNIIKVKNSWIVFLCKQNCKGWLHNQCPLHTTPVAHICRNVIDFFKVCEFPFITIFTLKCFKTSGKLIKCLRTSRYEYVVGNKASLYSWCSSQNCKQNPNRQTTSNSNYSFLGTEKLFLQSVYFFICDVFYYHWFYGMPYYNLITC